jgi:type IV pilus assembly protein PilQ
MGKNFSHNHIKITAFICLAVGMLFANSCATTAPSTDQAVDQSSPQPLIQSVEVSPSPNATVVRIENSDPAPYTTFMVPEPARIVLHIKGRPGPSLPRTIPVGKGGIREIRWVEDEPTPGTTKMVLHLEKPYEYKAAEEGKSIRLTLQSTPQQQQSRSSGAETAQRSPYTPSEPRIFFEPRDSLKNLILGVDFTMLEKGKSRLVITTDKKVTYRLDSKGAKHLHLDMPETDIPPLLQRRLDSKDFEGVVDLVKATSSKQGVSVDVLLRDMVPYHVKQEGPIITIEFDETTVRPVKRQIVPLRVAETGKTATARGGRLIPISSAATQATEAPVSIPGLMKKRYTGTPMTMDFVNADVTNILRLIGEVSDLNIVWGPEVKGNVSMRLKEVPWDQALDLILANNNLAKRQVGNVIWVTTKTQMNQLEAEEKRKREELEAEKLRAQEELKKAQEAARATEPLFTEYIPVDFADAAQIKEHIVVTERGTISVDARTNTIILNDTADSIGDAKKTVSHFDTPVKQIMIESRIVDATNDWARDLGIEWQLAEGQKRNNTGVPFGLPTDATTYTSGGDALYGGVFTSNSPPLWSPNIGLSLGVLTSGALGAITLDANLALAETEGSVNIISAPKVLASNGEKAEIKRGTVIYKELITADTSTVEELEASLSLVVTPTVSYNDFVTMEIALNDDINFLDGSGKTLKTVKTSLIVKSGDTIVIGGIYTENQSENESGIPWLRDIPGLGWLFKAESKVDNRTELLIFLTPTVVEASIKR